MPKIPDKVIDMVLVDLPYGMTNNKWDVVIPFEPLWEELIRITKDNAALVFTASQPFTSLLVLSNPDMFRYELIWEKNKFSDFLNANKRPLKIHENILIFSKKQSIYNPQFTYSDPYVRWNTQEAVDKQTNYGDMKRNVVVNTDGRRYPTSVLKYNRIEDPKHPTEKPVELFEYLVKTYSNKNDVVLDCCIGAGTTAEACIRAGRNFIGIEIEEEYVKISRDRIHMHGMLNF